MVGGKNWLLEKRKALAFTEHTLRLLGGWLHLEHLYAGNHRKRWLSKALSGKKADVLAATAGLDT